jgi:hypothetical protein
MAQGVYSSRAAGLSPSRVAISFCLFSLTHFTPTRGIRCDQALPTSTSC